MSYQIFLSYSHKDADIYGQEYIWELKRQIEASIGCDDVVFLDAEALGIGNEWNAKIKSSLHSCQAFICLLSENYINSEYCTRERLWWAQKEMKNGRLHQATLPSEKCKNQGSFCKCLIINKVLFLYLTLQGGSY